ncbi:MAG: hypothetical protein WC246_02970 [Candidatus Paceibacterota bacterium]|jgi:ribulose-phosphate 3-epimerase
MRTSIAINEPTRALFADKLRVAKTIIPSHAIVHTDVSDGAWTPVNAVISRTGMQKYGKQWRYAAHLMLPWKKIMNAKWYDGTFETVYLHAREVKNWDAVRARAKLHHVHIGVVMRVGDTQKIITSIPLWVRAFLVLAVVPGKSGQLFNKKALTLMPFLKKSHPRATIIVDGGINKKTAAQCKKAGADGVVSASYIWNAADPQKAYRTLEKI